MAHRSDANSNGLASLILAVLESDSLHGYAIAKRIKEVSEDALDYGEGSLYPALKGLLAKDYVVATWDTSGPGAARKVYSITQEGTKQLAAERESWRKYSRSFSLVLGGQSA